jgi:magnesium transporter
MSSNQTGEVVKLLTMITLITTPLTLVGTWYGMNFQNMPEYKWRYGYEMAIAITVVWTALIYWWFKKKRWF